MIVYTDHDVCHLQRLIFHTYI